MARKKASDGVVATIERLTGKIPCPMYLRQILNKYLYQEELFEGAKSGKTGGGAKRLGHLHGPILTASYATCWTSMRFFGERPIR
jgi:hypothetical protein